MLDFLDWLSNFHILSLYYITSILGLFLGGLPSFIFWTFFFPAIIILIFQSSFFGSTLFLLLKVPFCSCSMNFIFSLISEATSNSVFVVFAEGSFSLNSVSTKLLSSHFYLFGLSLLCKKLYLGIYWSFVLCSYLRVDAKKLTGSSGLWVCWLWALL